MDEVDLLEANPHYAHVRYPDGRETTVSTRHLAPKGEMEEEEESESFIKSESFPEYLNEPESMPILAEPEFSDEESSTDQQRIEETAQRKSTREHRPPHRYGYDEEVS